MNEDGVYLGARREYDQAATYRKGRKCKICKKKLSMYNPEPYCFVCAKNEIMDDLVEEHDRKMNWRYEYARLKRQKELEKNKGKRDFKYRGNKNREIYLENLQREDSKHRGYKA